MTQHPAGATTSSYNHPAPPPFEIATRPRPPGIRNTSARATWTRRQHDFGYIVDASVVSRTWPYRRDPSVCSWLATAPRGSLYVPAAAMEVIQRGIELERETEPEHARELEEWRDSLRSLGFILVPPLEYIERNAQTLGCISKLKNLWEKPPRHEIYVVATSIAFRMKIATLSTRRYRAFADAGITLPGFVTLGCRETRQGVPGRLALITTAKPRHGRNWLL